MKYSLAFFPVVGVIIGAFLYLWWYLADALRMPELPMLLIAVAIPLLVTGGFHVDGFLDVMDAIHSYGDFEKKLAILKDPHVGAFAIIRFAVFGLLFLAGFDLGFVQTTEMEPVFAIMGSFVLSRILSAFGVLYLKPAKKEGMLYTFQDSAAVTAVKGLLVIEFVTVILLEFYFGGFLGILVVISEMLVVLYYGWFSKKHFGGITGDTAGYFVCVAELLAVLLVGVCGYYG